MSASHPIEQVGEFAARFKLPEPRYPMPLPLDLFMYRYQFLQEELIELLDAQRAGDLTASADALIDLIYVAYGTARMMGLASVWQPLWALVHQANLAKERVVNAGHSPRRSPFDVVKPAGWVAPTAAQRRLIDEAVISALGPLYPKAKP